MPELGDPIGAIVALLLADAGVTALNPIGVFGGELPDAASAQMPAKALTVKGSGGTSLTGGSNAEHDTARIDVFAYGPTQQDANKLLRTAALALRRVPRTVAAGTLVHWVRPAGGGTTDRDPSLAWPRAFQSFQIFHALEAVQ